MRFVCPSCGAIASAEIWANDAACRDAVAAMVSLPDPLPKHIIGYMSLFRPTASGLTWKKALRLTGEIGTITASGYVAIQGKVDRDCPARIWALAMEQMVERRVHLTLPLKNHNYLRQVAWQLADQENARHEQASYTRPAARPQMAARSEDIGNISSPLDQYVQGLRENRPTDEEMEQWKTNGKTR